MRAWTVDADDIRVAEDFDSALLHRTPEIDDFLSHGGDKFVVIGTKGFGKTLLLKAKRVLVQSGGVVCLPERSLLDKPIGDKVFSKEAVALYADSPLWWSKVWLTSIALATLKRLDRAAGLDVSPRLRGLIADQDLRGVIDHFVRLLDFSPGELQRCANDTDGYLVPRLRAIDVPVAIFIDSVDEYFNKHVETGAGRASAAGELAPNIWYFSQLGLVEVGYQLRRINHHLKVFAAVRKEAYLRLPDSTVMSQQYHGSAVDIVYAVESLHEIFVGNIRREPASRLVLPDRVKEDPIAAFFGLTHFTHGYTGEREDVFSYVCRHTLLRPRDFMTVGQRISAMKPGERTEDRLKAAVNAAATDIANEYLREIAPYLGDLDLNDVLARIPGHIMTRDEVEALFCEYNDAAASPPGAELHVCCALFKAGLLGYLQHDMVDGTRRQRFLRPGEGTFEPDGVLPRSTHYLVHPVLSQIVARLNHAYAERIDRVNVVGSGRPWRDPDEPRAEVLAVLQADVRGMLGLMERGIDAPVRRAIEDAVARHAEGARSREITEGDHVLITHDDPALLARIARRILDDVYDAPGRPLLRMALHHGEVRLQTSGTTAVVTGGQAIAVAARIEPRVMPGEIWCTEAFCAALERAPSLCRTVFLEPPAGAGGQGPHHGSFNVRKDGSDEADIWVRLFRVEF
jgi:class 3 adenylate cyclase